MRCALASVHRYVLVGVLLGAVTLTSTTFAQSTEADIAARVTPSIVQVLTKEGSAGSGVRVDGGVITNAHVVKDASAIKVTTGNGLYVDAQLAQIDEDRDLALLTVDLAAPPLNAEPALAQRQGDPLLVVGFPRPDALGVGGQATITRGLLSAVRTSQDGLTLVQTDAALNPGNSGGAIVNMRGRLIGISSFAIRDSAGLNFGIGTETIQSFLDSNGYIGAMSVVTADMANPLPVASPPDDTVAVTPQVSGKFAGDPKDLVLQASDLGSGWTPGRESRIDDGAGRYYSMSFDDKDYHISQVWVQSFNDMQKLETFWTPAKDASNPGETVLQAPQLGDASLVLLHRSGYTAEVRRANIIFQIDLSLLPEERPQVDTLASLARKVLSRIDAHLS